MAYHTILKPYDLKLFPVGDPERQLAYARIFRYTSIAYLKKIEEHFVVFAEAYEIFIKKVGFNEDRRFLLQGFFGYLNCLQKGLKKLQDGDHSGYSDCLESCGLTELIYHRRFQDSYALDEIGRRHQPKPAVALYRLCEKLIDMLSLFHTNVGGFGGFNPEIPMRLSEVAFLNGQLPPLPPPQAKPLPTNTPVPVSGIYLALHDFGYPSYYAQGMWTREAIVPDELEEDYRTYTDYKNKVPPIKTMFYNKTVPVEWVLIWKDDRYRGGKIPDESHFIEETCELPTYSLAPPPLTDDD